MKLRERVWRSFMQRGEGRAGNETKVTRRDETRDGPDQFVSRLKLTRRDEMRDQVHKEQNFTQNFDPNFDILNYFFLRDRNFSSRRSRETKSWDETRSRRSRLVSSRVFSRRDRLVTGPTFSPSVLRSFPRKTRTDSVQKVYGWIWQHLNGWQSFGILAKLPLLKKIFLIQIWGRRSALIQKQKKWEDSSNYVGRIRSNLNFEFVLEVKWAKNCKNFKKPWIFFWQILVNTVVTKNFNLAYSFISPISKHFVFKDISKLNRFRYQKVIHIATTRTTTTQTVWLRRAQTQSGENKKERKVLLTLLSLFPPTPNGTRRKWRHRRKRKRKRSFCFRPHPPPLSLFYSRSLFPFFFCENGRRRRLVSRRPISTPSPLPKPLLAHAAPAWPSKGGMERRRISPRITSWRIKYQRMWNYFDAL